AGDHGTKPQRRWIILIFWWRRYPNCRRCKENGRLFGQEYLDIGDYISGLDLVVQRSYKGKLRGWRFQIVEWGPHREHGSEYLAPTLDPRACQQFHGHPQLIQKQPKISKMPALVT